MALGRLADDALDVLSRIETGGLFERTLRIGVTGLSRSGKTVFVTSLVHNLLQRARLQQLRLVAEGRFEVAILRPQPDPEVARFAFEAHRDALLGADPHWPEGTRRISQLRLSIRYRPTGLLARAVGGSSVLNLDIVDYPGEWLLDLPLLRLSFADWSAKVLAQAERGARAQLSADWRAALGRTDPDTPADEETAQRLAGLFTAYLRAARGSQANLSELSPGRFLLPGEMEGSPALTFCPLPPGEGPGRRGSLRAAMEERYRAYVRHVVQPFYTRHFARLDRQIVLMDLMSALNAGEEAWRDLETAMDDIMESFRPGPDSWLRRLIGGRVTRLLFAATKADQLHHSQHAALEGLMAGLVRRASDRAAFAGAGIGTMAIAGVRATTETTVREGGEPLACVEGTPAGAAERAAVFPGHLPDRIEDLFPPGMAQGERYHFVSFAPPRVREPERGLPHIRVDRALDWLIGEAAS
ncbi:YcjX family GTP-binding protein [Futiania mangrovi]|uniref:YcjX family protein n=1 Tax=Futiania mangrovi TaxID=2959716 RepID=A0A9J6P9B1_9PROT|nr:YcjX family protein [Futiania mangrovii]MCP1334801.1 YcjX family protein [Futiania mangrovii]